MLLVDDQPAIIRALELGLKRRALGVLTAGNGHDALAVLRSPQDMDILVSDIVMPGGVSGLELARMAVELRPGLPVLLTTGYSYDQLENRGTRSNEYEVLRKPFSVVELVSRINALVPSHSRDTSALW